MPATNSDASTILARLITRAAERTQVIVVTDASQLISGLEVQPNCKAILL